MASIKEKIAGLYIAFFNRAADKAGLNYWTAQADALDEDTAVKTLSAAFATHPQFTELYEGMNNTEYVEAIYLNMFGQSGDAGGIIYWSSLLDEGLSRSDMIADFVSAVLDFEREDSQYATLSDAELNAASKRQQLLQNKVDVSLYFIESLGDTTNLDPLTDPSDPVSLEHDPVYLTSVAILANVNSDISSKEKIIQSIDLLKENTKDVISAINELEESQPTPSYQNTGLGELSTVETQWIDTLLSGDYWDASQTVITYGFNTSIPEDYYNYRDGTELTSGWTELNDAQKSTMESIFDNVEKLLDVTFEYAASDAMIEVNIVDMDADTVGFSFYPGDYYTYEGDIFLSSQFNTNPDEFSLEVGRYGYRTMVHELGHALGLKHPFEGESTLPDVLNDTNHSVMSYTNKDNMYAVFETTQTRDGKSIVVTADHISPDLYSLYDVTALQAIYGVNENVATGNDTYSLAFSDFEIETIWDAGGVDTLDLSAAYGTSTIDLNPGSLNSADQYSLDEVVRFYQNKVGDENFNDFIYDFIVNDLYADSLLYTGKNNLAIAIGTIIENVITGVGNDVITDNLVDNDIFTAAGDDTIYLGYGGYDHVDGGAGNDIVYLDRTQESIIVTQLNDGSYDLLAQDNSFEANLIGIETISFSDGIVTL